MMIPILEVAKLLGVSTQSIRLWEKKGLIPPAERTPGGHRRYDLDAVRLILKKKDL